VRRLWRGVFVPAFGVVATMVASACGGDEQVPARDLRFGIFRDLVLYEREAALGGAFFLDRFETTRADWQVFLEELGRDGASGAGAPTDRYRWLPVVNVSLPQARRYARWRFCRLPTYGEWRFAATGGGRYTFPWGDRFVAEWVNSWDLGLDEPTIVGTFESGREWGGAYDLLGNVAEWTESVAPRWFDANPTQRVARGYLPATADAARASAATRRWLLDGLPPPAYWVIESWGDQLPRMVAGGHFRSLIDPKTPDAPESLGPRRGYDAWLSERQAGENGQTVGIRLATDPMELIEALLQEEELPAADGLGYLLGFLAVEEHRRVLTAALPRALRRTEHPGPLAAVLERALAP